MSREIKFRGKTRTTEGEKWVYGYLYKVKSFFDEDENCYIRNEHITDFIVDKDTVGQYTGLKDKNGVEIYEGDILEYMAIADGKQTDKVIFDRGTFVVDYSEDYKQPVNEINHCAKVIGNIYDNPELIEKEGK